MNRFFLSLALLSIVSCTHEAFVGRRIAALEDSVWEASQWISVKDAPVVEGVVTAKENCRAADGASWFVLVKENGKRLESVKWMTTGLGVYDLFVNGRLVGEEILKPGFTHYAKTKRSFTYDVTDAIRKTPQASNTFSAQVTPGWWADKIITPAGHQGMRGRKCAFRCVLELRYADGSREVIGTDTLAWKAGIAGPVKHAAIFDGEEYDARLLPGYEVFQGFSAPELNTEFQGEILPSEGAEAYQRFDLAISPIKAWIWEGTEGETEQDYGKAIIKREWKDGDIRPLLPGETLVVDFGQNCSAVPLFVFKAEEGTTLSCLPGEILNDGNGSQSRGMDGPEGSVHRTNLRVPDEGFRINYTFGPDKGYVSYIPRTTYFGYRYISVQTGGPVIIKSIHSIPVTSITNEMEIGNIETGSEEINQLISNARWGMISNYLSVPTDCPQRNERLGWMADTQVFAETGTFFADTRAFFHKWMRDVRDSQTPSGAFPGVSPTAQYGNGKMRFGWADAGIIVPWIVWKQYADVSLIDECWESMDRFMRYVDETNYDHNAHLHENGNSQFADWLSYEPFESYSGSAYTRDAAGKKRPRPEALDYWNFLSAGYWAMDADMMADMATASGRDDSVYREMNKRAKAYIRERFILPDGSFATDILNTMQTPALFALKAGVVENEAKDAVCSRLRENFAAHGNCLQTGFLGTSILMSTLSENGMTDIAYDLLFQHKNPSWLYSIDNGATTIWERWNSYTKEKGMGPKGMNSFNHYAYGCVCAWIWETSAGIAADTSEPGFKRIIMKPVPDRRLGSVDAKYRSAAGLIKSSWHYEGNTWIWNFTVPEGASALVTLPGETLPTLYERGTYQLRKDL